MDPQLRWWIFIVFSFMDLLQDRAHRRRSPDYQSPISWMWLMMRIDVASGSTTGQNRIFLYLSCSEGASPTPPAAMKSW
jgi:hypothetical protein